MRTNLVVLALFVGLVACGDDASGDAGSSDARIGTDANLPPEDAGGSDAVEVLDGSMDSGPFDAGAPVDAGPPVDPVASAGAVEAVAGEFRDQPFGFLEGPHWNDGQLFFTDQFFGRPDRTAVYALTPPSTVSIIVQPSDGANGLATNGDGELIACLQAGRRLARITAGSIETLFDRYEGSRFNAPNDLVFRGDGSWFFTDPGYGSEGDAELDTRSVYFVDGAVVRAVWDGTLAQRPNGITLSPDESVLYLADTADGLVRAFDVELDGTLSGEREFAEVRSPDGMTVDSAGNLYVTTSDGIDVFAPDGSSWGTLSTPMQPSNCAFGGDDRRTLYVTARTTLYRVPMAIAGIERR